MLFQVPVAEHVLSAGAEGRYPLLDGRTAFRAFGQAVVSHLLKDLETARAVVTSVVYGSILVNRHGI
jgi:hypothetical protein